MTKRDITIDDMFKLKLLNTPEISPHGEKIVFTYKWTDLKENKYYSNLYMFNLKDNSAVPFTRGNNQDSYPLWSPDGTHIVFRSDRDKKNGLWLIPATGGEAYGLVTDKGSVGEYLWCPDGKHIAYTFRKPDPPVPLAHLSNDPEYKHKEEDENPYDIIEEIPYKAKNGKISPKGKFNIYMINIETMEKVQLTDDNHNDYSIAFSPDGKKLAFCSNHLDPIHDYENNDIYILTLEGKEIKKITDKWGSRTGLAWSGDGKYIYYTGHHAPKGEGGAEDLKIYKMPSEGGEEILLTKDFQGYVSNMLIGDTREFDDIVQPPAFIDGEKNMLFCASYHGGCYFYQIPSEGGVPERIEDGEHEIVYYTIDKKCQNMAVLKGNILEPAEIFHYKKNGDKWEVKKLTSYNAFIYEETNITKPEDIWFTTSEGTKVQGWLIKPPDFDSSKKYPLVHQIHGGPHILYGYTFFHEMHYFASKGYCVLFINPRGSRGYGSAFTKHVDGHWGRPDFIDQMEFLEHVVGKGYIDKDKLFVTGGSYGGYMTNWVVTQTGRYCAAASHRSVSNCTTIFGVSSGCFHFEHTFGGIPWRDFEHYRAHSPLHHVENVTTPILIMHSENDHLTPICEAEQFFVALKYLGKTVRFARFKGETHELSRGGKPTNRRARLEIVLDWFEKYRNA